MSAACNDDTPSSSSNSSSSLDSSLHDDNNNHANSAMEVDQSSSGKFDMNPTTSDPSLVVMTRLKVNVDNQDKPFTPSPSDKTPEIEPKTPSTNRLVMRRQSIRLGK